MCLKICIQKSVIMATCNQFRSKWQVYFVSVEVFTREWLPLLRGSDKGVYEEVTIGFTGEWQWRLEGSDVDVCESESVNLVNCEFGEIRVHGHAILNSTIGSDEVIEVSPN